jgi:hypothetical protein
MQASSQTRKIEINRRVDGGGAMSGEGRRIDRALAALAADLEIKPLRLDEDNQCLLAVGDQGLLIQYFEDSEAVVLCIDLGVVSDDAANAVLRRLMIVNTSWRDTGGGTLGFEPESGRVVLMSRIALDEISAERFVERVGDLVEAGKRLHALVGEVMALQMKFGIAADPRAGAAIRG